MGPFPHASTRRAFLATGTAALAATAMSGSARPAVHAAGSETLKVALIGCGARGAGAAFQALSTGGPVVLWALADAFEDRLQNCLKTLEHRADVVADKATGAGGGPRVDVPKERQFIGLDAYRHAVDSGVDVVLLAEPPGFRPKHFEYAVAAGKHVFMEKPVATDAPGVRRVLAAADEAKKKGLKIGVGLQRHHQKSYVEAIPRLQENAIGDIVMLRCYWKGGMPAKSPQPRGDRTELEHQVANWYFFNWLSGDHICEQHVHNLDVCNWIKNAHPVEAHGLGGREVRTGKEYGNIFDHHSVEYTYADGVKMFSQCQQIPGCVSRVAEFAHGVRGLAELGNTAKIHVPGKKVWTSRRGGKDVPYQTEQDAFFDAIRNDRPYSEAEYGAMSTMTAIMGRMATYSGKLITWDQAFQSQERLTTNAESWDAEPPIRPDDDGYYAVAIPGRTKIA